MIEQIKIEYSKANDKYYVYINDLLVGKYYDVTTALNSTIEKVNLWIARKKLLT